MDLSKLSDDDLRALNSGDYSKLSDDGLKMLHEQTKPPSQMESVGRGALQGATLGYSDEATGAGEAMLNKLMGSHEKLLDLYKKHRDEARANNKSAQEANPKSYLAGEIGGGASTLIIPGAAELGLGARGAAAIGAAAGLGNSDADLTKGEVGQAAKDTATGAVTGVALNGAVRGLSALKNNGGQMAERMAIKSLNASPEETGAMLKAVGDSNRENVGRTLLRNKILGKYGLASDNNVAENLQRTSDTLGNQQSDLISKLGDRSASMDQVRNNVLDRLDKPYSTEAQKATDYVGSQLDSLPKDKNISLRDLTDAKRQWQGLSDYPSAGSPTQQDVSNSSAMKDATGGLRKTISDIAPEMNPQLRSESNIYQARESMRTRPDLLSTHGTSMLATGVRAAKSYGNQIGAVTTDKVSQLLKSSPQVLGRFASTLSQAAQRSPESLSATLHVLSMSDPEFRQLSQNLQEPSEQQ